jgi:hypothetical protein
MTADNAMAPIGRTRDAEPVELLVRALQPVVAEFLDQGIGVGEWIAAIKIASFQAAHAATDAESGRAIFARIAVRTGMTRTELQQLRQLLRNSPAEWPKTIGRQRTARVIEGWYLDERYHDEQGLPLPLMLVGGRRAEAAEPDRAPAGWPLPAAAQSSRPGGPLRGAVRAPDAGVVRPPPLLTGLAAVADRQPLSAERAPVAP